MARMQVSLKGISTIRNYEDGDMAELINLRNQGGVLMPVSPRETKYNISVEPPGTEYYIIFIHKTNSDEHIIGVRDDDESTTILVDIDKPNPVGLMSVDNIKINKVEAVGNMLCFIADNYIYYALRKDGNYLWLGLLPELPVMLLSSTVGKNLKLPDLINPNSSEVLPTFGYIYGNNVSVDINNIAELTKGLVNFARNHDAAKGYFFDAFYIRYAFRMFDGSLSKHSPPILCMPNVELSTAAHVSYDRTNWAASTLNQNIYKISVKIPDLSNILNFPDIIKGIDFFISPEMGLSNPEDIKIKAIYTSYYNVYEVTEAAMKNIKETSTFYLAKSLPIDNENPLPEWVTIERIENLETQEIMSDDAFTHNTFGGKNSLIYNSRLHIADIATKIFNGFQYKYFSYNNNSYNGSSAYSGDHPIEVPAYIKIKVDIDLGSGLKSVYTFAPTDGRIPTAVISYPDSRARSVTFYSCDANGTAYRWGQSYQLLPHPFLNLAMYIETNLKSIYVGDSGAYTVPYNYDDIILLEHNKIKVSETNSPTVFLPDKTYYIGNNTILAISPMSQPIAEQTFGQFPLLVFTSSGIYALQVGTTGDTLYNINTPVTSDSVPISPVICNTPYGVIYITKQGVYAMSSAGAQWLTPSMEYSNGGLTVVAKQTFAYSTNFLQFLAGISGAFWNARHNEIWFINPDYNFNIVFSLLSKTIYKTTERIDIIVRGQEPNVLLYNAVDKTIKDGYKSTGDNADVKLVTRPMSLGAASDRKMLERVILRGRFFNVQPQTADGLPSFTGLYMSQDGIIGQLVKVRSVSAISGGNVSDSDLGLLASAKSNYYGIMLNASISETSTMNYIDIEINKEYDSTKMR